MDIWTGGWMDGFGWMDGRVGENERSYSSSTNISKPSTYEYSYFLSPALVVGAIFEQAGFCSAGGHETIGFRVTLTSDIAGAEKIKKALTLGRGELGQGSRRRRCPLHTISGSTITATVWRILLSHVLRKYCTLRS